MSQVIEVPGLGNVEFPDDMSEKEIADAIDAQLAQQNQPSGETQQPAAGPVAPSTFDMSNPQSTARQIIDPLAAGAAVVGGAAYDATKYALTHPFETATTLGAASYVPGINKLPVVRDVKSARENAAQRYLPNAQGPAVGPIAPGTAPGFQPGTGTKIPITSQQTAQPAAQTMPQQSPGDIRQAKQFEAYKQIQQQMAGQQAMPQQQAPQQPPTAANYIERMHGLADKYKTANPVIVKQPTTNKAPAMRVPGGGMEGGIQPVQIQQGPDITPELRRYKEQNIYNTFR